MANERIPLQEEAAPGSFDEGAYLAANPDVEEAVRRGDFKCGRHHFDLFGSRERRKQYWGRSPRLRALRRAKMARLAPFLRLDLEHRIVDGKYDFLTQELRQRAGISHGGGVSDHVYDTRICSLLEQTAHGLVLDCGAGKRDAYLSNVVNFEIADYDTTDVLGVGETLPFQDGTFDGVISVAVLEHVKDPFRCAGEIARTLKPGGWLFCSVPLLQPYHGYPHHYFNMTHEGLRSLFDRTIDVEQQYVNDWTSPLWALSWIASGWADGLTGPTRDAFLDMRLRDLIEPLPLMDKPFVRELGESKKLELACATILVGRKRGQPEARR